MDKVAEIKDRVDESKIARYGTDGKEIELANMPWEKLEKENRKLREERDHWLNSAKHWSDRFDQIDSKLQSEQQEIEKLTRLVDYDTKEILTYVEREQKLIEGLQWYANEIVWVQARYEGRVLFSVADKDKGQRARNIIAEIGVTVE